MGLAEDVKNLPILYFQSTPAYEALQNAMMQLEKAEEIAYAMQTKNESDELTAIKIGTTLSLAVIEKIITGKNPKNFSKEDWNDIAEKVTDKAIMVDGQAYTAWVFNLYAEYIDASVKVRKAVIPAKYAAQISGLSQKLRDLTEELQQGKLKEVDYVDQCLWISFEAMIKLIASFTTGMMAEEFSDFVVSVSDYAIQYARLSMYQKENALLEAYLRQQGALDAELQQKYEQYVEELEEQTEKFSDLIENAYSADFQKRLVNTVKLAKEAGVPDEKILSSIDKIDDFFN